MRLLTLFLLFSSTIFAQNTQVSDAVSPTLEYICELKVTTDKAVKIGETSRGERRFIPITGGTFEGPKLRGTVLNGGADYQYFKENKNGDSRTEIEAIYTIKTEDGILIHIRNVGLVTRSKAENEAQKAGKPVNFNNIYFRAAPKFEAPSDSKYDWMNNAIFVCKGIPTGQGYVRIQVWQVL